MANAIANIEFWRLCSNYTVAQAALLMTGHDPAIALQVEQSAPSERPPGYEAARHALEQALKRDDDFGHIAYLDRTSKFHGYGAPIDALRSLVWVSTLRKWLEKSGITTLFSFNNVAESKELSPDYLDRDNPRYSAKLAAAVHAWEACEDPSLLKAKSPKKVLEQWLQTNASAFGLCDEAGRLNVSGIREVAKVANWQPTGGAPTTQPKTVRVT
jgi:hypothetical protein